MPFKVASELALPGLVEAQRSSELRCGEHDDGKLVAAASVAKQDTILTARFASVISPSPPILGGIRIISVFEKSQIVIEHLHAHARKGVDAVFHAFAGSRGIDVLAAYHEVDGAAEPVGDLPGGGQRDAAVGAAAGALVARVGGAGDAERLGEVLGGAEARLAAEALECSFAADAARRGMC